MSIYIDEVKEYFRKKAKKYDDVDKQAYWRLSDELLWNVLTRYLRMLPDNFTFLDAGGGTGRWALKILSEFPNSSGTIADISHDMLNEATLNSKRIGVSGRLKIVNKNLEDFEILDQDSYDICYNFHNVLGFVENPINVLTNITSFVKKGGYVISFVPNLYHALFFNITIGNIEEASSLLRRKRGKFVNVMPDMNFFTPKIIKELYGEVGLKIVQLTGFPTIIYPGYQETQLHGSTKNLKSTLENQKYLNLIREIEKQLIDQGEEIASRGNNIFICGKK